MGLASWVRASKLVVGSKRAQLTQIGPIGGLRYAFSKLEFETVLLRDLRCRRPFNRLAEVSSRLLVDL